MASSLNPFHPVVREWFKRCIGSPTPVQSNAWPPIASGEHVLATAPTGSGKTLAAFLWGVNQLLTGAWSGGTTRVIYVSPLKALNNDIHRNLERPLAELRQAFDTAGIETPPVTVFTRSGDTPQRDRERMLRHPPEILITTPESLNLLLSSKRARINLDSVCQVIIDEVHAVAGSKRGTHLITAIDRLVLLSGEFQRIAMSASVRPLDVVAEFVGGYTLEATDPEPMYAPRPVRIIQAPQSKRYALRVVCPEDRDKTARQETWWPALTSLFKERLKGNRSTLLFVNSRRLCERVTAMINEGEPELLAYPHHGSLSRELRLLVEQKLKDGELKAIVATSSLELGIDVGELDEALMVETPFNVTSALQRVGRAGHRVGEESRGVMFPIHGRDFLHAAVMARCIIDQDIETVEPIACPLDVLTQVITSMTVVQTWNLDALYAFIRTSAPYRGLPRNQFDLVVEMLAGRYQDTRMRSLDPLASVDRLDQSIVARDRARLLLSMNGGTIPDRGYFDLRREDDGAKLGELDEEFVWERSLGHIIAFGNRMWMIRTITDNEVLVAPVARNAGEVPFWKADESDASHHFAERVAIFLEDADTSLDKNEFAEALQETYCMEPAAADSLLNFLRRQRAATGAPLPHRHHLVAEHYEDEREDSDTRQIILHTLWGGSLNRPFALALAQAYEDKYGSPLEAFSNNDSVVAIMPHALSGRELIDLVPPSNIESLLRGKLERSGYFGARFRENAGRALLLPRRGFRKRMPLWMNRLRARKLMETIARHNNFPILLETWRTCFRDIFELDLLAERLDAITGGTVAITDCQTSTPSPFAEGVVWRQTNKHMYEQDGALEGGPSQLDSNLIREAVYTADLRPNLPAELIAEFTRKLQRTYPGYAPGSPRDLIDWVRERRFVPRDEWDTLCAAMNNDPEVDARSLVDAAAPKLANITLDGDVIGVVALDDVGRSLAAWNNEQIDVIGFPGHLLPDTLESPNDVSHLSVWLADWLRFYGPKTIESLAALLPISEAAVNAAIDTLVQERLVARDVMVSGATALQVCDAENLERLLRIARRIARVDDVRIPLEQLPQRLAMLHGVAQDGGDTEAAVERLLGYPLYATEVERSILPARFPGYQPEALDTLLQDTDAIWFGCGEKRVSFGLRSAMNLFKDSDTEVNDNDPPLFPDASARYSFSGLIDRTGLDSPALTKRLWTEVWGGRVSNDSFDVIRQGLTNRFRPPKLPDSKKQLTRGALHRWKLGRPESGHWFAVPTTNTTSDAIEMQEAAMERARILLGRYGVVFRVILGKELPEFRWHNVFGALRRMELAGEVFAGNFIDGLPDLQFATPEFVANLKNNVEETEVFWINATDPASLCGIDLPGIKGELPRRVPGTTIVYRGHALAVVSERGVGSIRVLVSPDDDELGACFSFIDTMLASRSTRRKLKVKEINGEAAARSPYQKILETRFDIERGVNDLMIWGMAPGEAKM
jgi:ATP-dependent Lhr-like helicase